MKRLLIVFLVVLCCVSCVERHKGRRVSSDSLRTPMMIIPDENHGNAIPLYPGSIEDGIRSFMTNRTTEDFENLCTCFLQGALPFEELVYALVAADKFSIYKGYCELAFCMTEGFSNLNISRNSQRLAMHFLIKGSENKETSSSNALKIIKGYAGDDGELLKPGNNKNNPITALKIETLSGSIASYKRLKKILYEKHQYTYLLYYSFIMADRYNYSPAKSDVIDIIKEFYMEYELGEFGVETSYFCSFFSNKQLG